MTEEQPGRILHEMRRRRRRCRWAVVTSTTALSTPPRWSSCCSARLVDRGVRQGHRGSASNGHLAAAAVRVPRHRPRPRRRTGPVEVDHRVTTSPSTCERPIVCRRTGRRRRAPEGYAAFRRGVSGRRTDRIDLGVAACRRDGANFGRRPAVGTSHVRVGPTQGGSKHFFMASFNVRRRSSEQGRRSLPQVVTFGPVRASSRCEQ